ncbi:MAG: AsnC family transcriptional regulator, partial [Actinomadura sp.]
VLVAVDGAAREVADSVAKREAVCFTALTAGPHDLVAQVRARDDDALAAEVDEIRRVPGVRLAEVVRCVATMRDAHSVVGALGDVILDHVDWRLLRELQRDGRAPYTRLAAIIGLSQAATRARVVRMMRSGVIQITGQADPSALGATEVGGFGLVVDGPVRSVADAVARQQGVRYVATGFGRYDIIGEAEATSPRDLVAVLDAVRTVPGATMRESWHHLDVVKESYAAELPDRLDGGIGVQK